MSRALRPATQENVIEAQKALELLRLARMWLRGADCPKALERVEATIKSTEGAIRHLERRARAKETS